MDNRTTSGLASQAFQKTRDIAEKILPPPTVSVWATEGKLTPNEFVAAGDKLISSIPGWTWRKAEVATRSYLPANKQFLVLKNILCTSRPDRIDPQALADAMVSFTDDSEDDWVLPPAPKKSAKITLGTQTVTAPKPKKSWDDEDEDDEDDEDEDEEEEPITESTTSTPPVDLNQFKSAPSTNTTSAVQKNQDTQTEDDHRLYNLSIVYDNYYNVPRVYLLGFSKSDGSMLTGAQLKEDINPGFLGDTVQMKAHPHTGIEQISIHPCGHAGLFREIIVERPESNPLTPDRAMLVLLKFITTAIPTIPYPLPKQEILQGT